MKKYDISKYLYMILIILIFIILVFVILRINISKQIRIAIYPSSGGYAETYYFRLSSSRKLLTEKGERKGNDLTEKQFIQNKNPYKNNESIVFDFQSEYKYLSNEMVEKIYSIVDEIYKKECVDDVEKRYDSWTVQILYKGRTIKQDYFDNDIPQIGELIDELISLSPIYVDLRGFS